MMTASQFSKALDNLGISQVEAALLLRVHPRTTRRWAHAERDIPGPVAAFLDHLIKNQTGRSAIRELKREAA